MIKIMTGKYEISIILTILSFGLPVLYFSLTTKAFLPFSFRKLIKSFNLALIVQIIFAFLYMGMMSYMDKNVYTGGKSTDLTDVFMDTGLTYIVIGAFAYLPSLIILNLVNYLISRLKK